ncbi:MAG TPA: right-handed parallel beta-helix repeat-containing protein [Tepidisphaeraceae bacterium]|nr:right-handed parallel beta-helix repeat-containing protein [Tepidisphaeraceae bacterium]
MIRALLLPLLLSGANLHANVVEPVRYANRFPGADPCVQMNNAILDLPANGGTVDARAFGPHLDCSKSGVTLNRPVKLLLGGTAFSWSFTGPLFNITRSGCSIEGLGRMGSTELQPPAGSAAIYVAPGLESTAIRHLYISGQPSRKPSFAIQIEAAPSPANNSTFMLEDVYIVGGFAGIRAVRPINSKLEDVRVSATVSDGFTFVGDGTTVTCINCYANGNGGNGFHVSGIANATFIGGEADTNKGDGLLVDMSSPGVASTGLTLSGLDIESNERNGIHLVNTGGTSISGSVIINNAADGLQMCGGRGLTMSGGRIAGNGRGKSAGHGIDLAPTDCPYTGSSSATNVAIVSLLVDVANKAGLMNDPRHVALSYLSSDESAPSTATISLGGAQWGVGSGAPSGSCTTGSLYTNLAGRKGTTLYVCEGTTWTPK